MNVQAAVAREKERHPERYCPEPRCLWRTGGGRCRRHPGPRPMIDAVVAMVMEAMEDPAYVERERQREAVGGEVW